MQLTQKERQAFSLSSLIRSMASGADRGSFELEILRDHAMREGRSFDARRIRLPWSLLSRRDLSVNESSAAYIVGASATPAVDALKPWSVAARAGITVLDGLTGNITIPRVTSDAAGQWLSGEFDAIDPSQPSLGQVSLSPKTAAVLTTFSRMLNTLNPSTEAFVQAHLMRVVGQMIDAAILNGSGIAGEPAGLTKATGIDTETGTSLAHSGTLAMQAAIAAAGAEVTGWVGDPLARKTLGARERATGLGFVWDNDKVLSRPAYATQSAPANTLFAGDWSQCVLGIWGSGFDLSVDAYSGWSEGDLTVRVLALVDVGIPNPAAFSVSTSIT